MAQGEGLIYTYGFCADSAGIQALPPGLNQDTQYVSVGPLGAIVEMGLDVSHLQNNDQQLMTAVLSHDRVLQDIFATVDILPLRFGTQFADLAALQHHLQQHQSHYLHQLQYLQGQAEYSLTLIPQPVTPPPLASDLTGRAYFLAKKQRLQDQQVQQQQQQAQMATWIEQLQQRGIALQWREGTEGGDRLYALAPKATFAQTLAALAPLLPDWEIQISTPLPPYHFATSP
jgi:hypothetical protein